MFIQILEIFPNLLSCYNKLEPICVNNVRKIWDKSGEICSELNKENFRKPKENLGQT